MYIPKYFKVTDFNEIIEFVRENSFGTIVTTDNGKPIATHIPLQFSKKGEDYFITGHMAYGNPQWRTLDTCEEALVIYQGPYAYISSSWYGHENVSTWNYQAVHVYGKATRMEADELKQDLSILQEKYEKHRKNAVLWENLSPEFLESQLKGVVGFKIKVREIQAAYKLSQNRNEEDYLNIINELQKEENKNSKRMAEIMKKRVHDKK